MKMKGDNRKLNILLDAAAVVILILAFILNGCTVAR
jgi:hypothetical protein